MPSSLGMLCLCSCVGPNSWDPPGLWRLGWGESEGRIRDPKLEAELRPGPPRGLRWVGSPWMEGGEGLRLLRQEEEGGAEDASLRHHLGFSPSLPCEEGLLPGAAKTARRPRAGLRGGSSRMLSRGRRLSWGLSGRRWPRLV